MSLLLWEKGDHEVVDEEFFCVYTPHPSAFGCHLPPLGKARFERTHHTDKPQFEKQKETADLPTLFNFLKPYLLYHTYRIYFREAFEEDVCLFIDFVFRHTHIRRYHSFTVTHSAQTEHLTDVILGVREKMYARAHIVLFEKFDMLSRLFIVFIIIYINLSFSTFAVAEYFA